MNQTASFKHTESDVSPGHVTRATLTWTLSACWKLVLIPNFGQTGLKLSLSQPSQCWISGKRNLREGRTSDPLLHRHLAHLHEKEAQGQPSCAKVKGKKSEIERSLTLSRGSFTMLGRKTLLSSISSLARTPSWVSKKVGVSHNRAKTWEHTELTQFLWTKSYRNSDRIFMAWRFYQNESCFGSIFQVFQFWNFCLKVSF